jgi:hypothetical protein
VFPLKPDSKRPLVSQHQATTDAEVLAGWWQRWPQALIGHRISPGRMLLDVDPRHGGMETWEALEDEYGPFRIGRMHYSGRGDGGFHAWFLRPDGLDRLSVKRLHQWAREREVGQAVGADKWTSGIDLLTHHHRYTILPPSPHPVTGQPYWWREELVHV